MNRLEDLLTKITEAEDLGPLDRVRSDYNIPDIESGRDAIQCFEEYASQIRPIPLRTGTQLVVEIYRAKDPLSKYAHDDLYIEAAINDALTGNMEQIIDEIHEKVKEEIYWMRVDGLFLQPYPEQVELIEQLFDQHKDKLPPSLDFDTPEKYVGSYKRLILMCADLLYQPKGKLQDSFLTPLF